MVANKEMFDKTQNKTARAGVPDFVGDKRA
jgi:hypothetical protein